MSRRIVEGRGAILDDAGAPALRGGCGGGPEAGAQVVVVHGGGAQVSRLMGSLGLEARRIRGLRVTDAATARAVVQGLCGEVNAELGPLVDQGVSALGLSGVDDRLMTAEILDPAGRWGV